MTWVIPSFRRITAACLLQHDVFPGCHILMDRNNRPPSQQLADNDSQKKQKYSVSIKKCDHSVSCCIRTTRIVPATPLYQRKMIACQCSGSLRSEALRVQLAHLNDSRLEPCTCMGFEASSRHPDDARRPQSDNRRIHDSGRLFKYLAAERLNDLASRPPA